MNNWQQTLTQSDKRYAFPVMTYPGIELADKSIMDVITDAESQFSCIEKLFQRYSPIAIGSVMDLSAEAEAFGSQVRYSMTEVPTVIGQLITNQADAEALNIPKVGDGRTSVYPKVCEIAALKLPGLPVFGGLIGPFSLAGRLMDMTHIMIATIEDPDTVEIVLNKCTDFLVEYATAFKEKGANGILIAEPAAGLLSPAWCEEFSSRYVKKIVYAVQDEEFMVILHNCGNTLKQVPSLVSTDARGLHFGNAVSMTDILPQIPEDRLAFGNIDPSSVFKNGTASQMEEKVFQLLTAMKPYPNFVLSSGCDVPPGTPLANIDEFYKTLDEFNRHL
ncbi:MAG: uroporphyrinogen decarboxylase family protein [Negativicutes bacterium]